MRVGLLGAVGTLFFFPEHVLSEIVFGAGGHEFALDGGAGRHRVAKPSWVSRPGSLSSSGINSSSSSSSSKSTMNVGSASLTGTRTDMDPQSSEPGEATSKQQTLVAATSTAAAPAAPVPAAREESGAAAMITGAGATSPVGTATLERGEASARTVFGRKEPRVPSVTLKLAMDRNGAVDDMAEGPKRFTSQESLDAVHRIRRDCEAVLVGVGTVVRDDPSLTVRRVPLNDGQTKQPTRVVLDRTLRLNEGRDEQTSCAILRDGHSSMVFYSSGCEKTEARAAELAAYVARSGTAASSDSQHNIPAVNFVGLPARYPGAGVDLAAVLEALFKRGVNHVLVEGGPSVAKGFLAEGLVDRAVIIRAPMEFSRPVPSHITSDTLQRAGLELVGSTTWGEDEVECWTRPGLSWPGVGGGRWP